MPRYLVRRTFPDGLRFPGGEAGASAAADVVAALPVDMQRATVVLLSDQPKFWGGPVQDERYLVVADREIEQ